MLAVDVVLSVLQVLAVGVHLACSFLELNISYKNDYTYKEVDQYTIRDLIQEKDL